VPPPTSRLPAEDVVAARTRSRTRGRPASRANEVIARKHRLAPKLPVFASGKRWLAENMNRALRGFGKR
jgi:hypothetical protein